MQTGSISSALNGNGLNNAKMNEMMGKDVFLQLLVTQLENQDPLNPMDNTEFVSQLAQFSSLEGITNLEKSMEGVASGMASMENMSTASLIGKYVMAEGSDFVYANQPVALNFSFEGNAADVAVSVYNSNGKLVKHMQAGAVSKGEHSIVWDGKDLNGVAAQAGAYSFSVSAKGADAKAVKGTTYVTGMISSVNLDPDGASIVINGSTVAKDKIKKIY